MNTRMDIRGFFQRKNSAQRGRERNRERDGEENEDRREMKQEPDELIKPSLNLVLCGRRGAEKTSAAKAILGQTELHSISNSSECVKYQGEVCGRCISLVELPALYAEPQEAVMEKSLRCISLSDPEGIHAFILVLPVSPITDEDKGELETIQNTFSSRVNDFTMILFNVESHLTEPAGENIVSTNKTIQKLLQSCGGRSVVFNIKDKQQVPELLETVDKIRGSSDNLFCYTTRTFLHAQMERVIQQQKQINKQQDELEMMKKKKNITVSDDDNKSSECLRIVLIGKTGTGKSATGNTILGRKEFKAKACQTSVTKYCKKIHSEVGGRPVAVVDGPGLLDTSLSNEDIYEEMVKCVSLLAPGPHVFLLVIRIGRLTDEEKNALKFIKEAFGKNSEKFTIILFTGGDTLERDGQSIEQYINENCDDLFKKLLSDCGGRYHVFNNVDKANHQQVSELVTKIDTMVKENGGNCFTNEMLQEAEAAIKKEMKRILKEKEEKMKKEKEELERKHEEEKEAIKTRMQEEKEKLQQIRDQTLKEMEENLNKEREVRIKQKEMREKENSKWEEEEERGRQEFKMQLETLDNQIKSEIDQKKSVDKKLEESREELKRQQEAWEEELRKEKEKCKQEDEKRRQEEEERMKELQEKYKQEEESYEKKRKEEDQIRREREEKEQQELEENYKTKMEKLEKTHEKEARNQAEEFNEFKEQHRSMEQRYENQMKDKDEKYDLLKAMYGHIKEQLKKRRQEEISDVVKTIKRRDCLVKIIKLLGNQEKEMKNVIHQKEKETLQETHEKQLSDLIEELLDEVDPDNRTSWWTGFKNFL